MPTKDYSDEEYRHDFLSDEKIHKSSLRQALDIRKFEIDLYWKRATYFWTFIAATLAGFVAIQVSSSQTKTDMSVLLACLGIVFSFGWLCVNRGSKYWQENWEYHVDMLEDKINGPLYKVVLTRSKSRNIKENIIHLATGPSPISVSKVNQLISLFVTLMWLLLLFYSLPEFKREADVNWSYVTIISLTAFTCTGFLTLGRTYGGGYWHQATIRTAKINK